MWRVIDRIAHGKGRAEDIDLLNSVADNIQGRTICALGDAAAMPVRAMLKHFKHGVRRHDRSGINRRRLREMVKSNSTARRSRSRRAAWSCMRPMKLGTYVPHFCYHKKLSIAANCRMCLVEVEKAPEASMPACATPVTPGMVVRTKSDKAL